MSLMLVTLILFFGCGFGAMHISFASVARRYAETGVFKIYMLPLLYIGMYYFLGTVCGYFLADNRDFIEPLTFMRAFLPICLAVVIYVTWLLGSGLIFNIVLAGAIITLVLAQPLGEGTPVPNWPNWCVRFFAIVVGFIFCRFYTIMTSTAQAFYIPLLMMLLGIIILSILGAAPMFSAIIAALYMGILSACFVIDYYGFKVGIDEGSCAAIAFLVFSLMMLQFGEFSFISCLMFGMVFAAELLTALWYKYINKHSENLVENSNFYAAATKYSFSVLAMNIAKICAVCLFLGWFQTFSVNNYSMPLILLFIILWLNYNFGRTAVGEKRKLKDINREFVSDLKQNIQEAKEALNAVKKDK